MVKAFDFMLYAMEGRESSDMIMRHVDLIVRLQRGDAEKLEGRLAQRSRQRTVPAWRGR